MSAIVGGRTNEGIFVVGDRRAWKEPNRFDHTELKVRPAFDRMVWGCFGDLGIVVQQVIPELEGEVRNGLDPSRPGEFLTSLGLHLQRFNSARYPTPPGFRSELLVAINNNDPGLGLVYMDYDGVYHTISDFCVRANAGTLGHIQGLLAAAWTPQISLTDALQLAYRGMLDNLSRDNSIGFDTGQHPLGFVVRPGERPVEIDRQTWETVRARIA